MCDICKDIQMLRNDNGGYAYCACTGAQGTPVYNPLQQPVAESKPTRNELQEYYGVIDYPVSEAVANGFRQSGYFVPAHLVRLPDSMPAVEIDSEIAQKIALLESRMDEILTAVNGMLATERTEVQKIKDYLRGQHEERKQESAQREPLIEPTVATTTPERARIPQGFNLPAEGMARLINGCAFWKALEQKQKAHPAEVTFDEWNNYIGTFVRFGKPGEERIIQFSRLAPDYDADSTMALIQTARSRQPKAPTCKELGCKLDPAKCGVGNG